MKLAICSLESLSPYGQSRFIEIPRLTNEAGNPTETHEDFERRVWKERAHWNERGNLIIPPMSLKNCLSEVAKFLAIQIPGRGKSTFTKHFESGLLVTDPIVLPVTRDTIEQLPLMVPADGVRGGSKRVKKFFPIVQHWKGDARIYILDETITNSVFERHLRDAGNFIGLGFFRPRRNGYFGRFGVNKIKWENS